MDQLRWKTAGGKTLSLRMMDAQQEFVAEAAKHIESAIKRYGGEISDFRVNDKSYEARVQFEGTNLNNEEVFIILKIGVIKQNTLILNAFFDGGILKTKPTRYAKEGWWEIRTVINITPEDFAEHFWKIYYG